MESQVRHALLWTEDGGQVEKLLQAELFTLEMTKNLYGAGC